METMSLEEFRENIKEKFGGIMKAESGLLKEVVFSALTLEQAEIRVIDHLKSLGINR